MTPLHTAAIQLVRNPRKNISKITPYATSYFRDRRRRIAEFFNIDTYSKPYLGHHELMEIFDYQNGFFVECGANNGEMVDPTYYLEKFRGWKGVLIEPLPKAAAACRKNRPASTVVETALVDRFFKDDHIKIIDCNAMSVTDNTRYNKEEWVSTGEKAEKVTRTERIVPATTLDNVLREQDIHQKIDLLVIDVEGSEESVLNGFSLDKYQPEYILIEIHGDEMKKSIEQILSPLYTCIANLAINDYLYQKL